MRFVFKTSYRQDMGLFRDGVQRNWYAALLAGLLVLPFLVPSYLVDISLVFIYGLCGLSLMVLAGYTGLVSLGHAAFLGIGAYAHVYFSQDLGLPWVVSVALAAMITAGAGVLVGLPALRMTGVYLTIATLAFALIIQEVLTHWDAVTGGLKGKAVAKAVIFGLLLRGRRGVLLPVPGLPRRRPLADAEPALARRRAGPGWRSGTARSRRSRWASTSPRTRPSPSPTRRG